MHEVESPRNVMTKRKWAVLAAGAVLSVPFSFFRIFDQDTWYHLATGRLIAGTGIPRTNTFSDLFADYPWKNTEWLFDLLLYRFYDAGGIPALQFVQIVLVAVTFILVLGTALQQVRVIDRNEVFGILALFLLVLSVSRFRFPVRPHLVTYLGMAVVLFLHYRRPRWSLIWLALSAVFWANCHAGVVFGFGLCAMFLLSAILERDPKGIKRAGWETGIFFSASLANPFHLYPYLFSVQHLNLGKDLPSVSEFGAFSPSAHGWTFPILIVIFFLGIPSAIRRKDWFFPMAGSVFMLLSLFAVREIPAFVIVVFPGLAAALSDFRDYLPEREKGTKAFVLVVLILAGLAALRIPSDWRHYGAHLRPGPGINEMLLPERAADFVLDRHLTGRMYNDYSQGGYLIWRLYPEHGVFQDGRATAYPPWFLQEMLGYSVILTPERWRFLMGRYECDFAIVKRNPFSDDPGVAVLFEAIDWPLVFLDGAALVYVRPGSDDERVTKGHVLDLISVTAEPRTLFMKGREFPQEMVRELSMIDPERLVVPYDGFRFAAAALGAGQEPLMERFLQRMWEMEGGDQDPEMIGELLAQMLREGEGGPR